MSSQSPIKRLPPLKSLVYFEAAARLRSFTRASKELSVTQGAVSRQIRQLEDFLGRSLFSRENRQVLLTDDGHNYYVSIAHLLAQLTAATESLLVPEMPNQVTVVTSSALASMYLLPRIPAFRKQFEDIQIRIIARENLTGLGPSEYDLALYYSRHQPEENNPVALFGEQVFAVCSPDYFKNHPSQFENNSFLPDNLIWLEIAEDWVNWGEWLEAMEIEQPRSANHLVVSNYSMVIQAAMDGQGVALAWSQLVDREIEHGTLVRPSALALETSARFYLMLPQNRPLRRPTEVFRNWLLGQNQ